MILCQVLVWQEGGYCVSRRVYKVILIFLLLCFIIQLKSVLSPIALILFRQAVKFSPLKVTASLRKRWTRWTPCCHLNTHRFLSILLLAFYHFLYWLLSFIALPTGRSFLFEIVCFLALDYSHLKHQPSFHPAFISYCQQSTDIYWSNKLQLVIQTSLTVLQTLTVHLRFTFNVLFCAVAVDALLPIINHCSDFSYECHICTMIW